MPADAPAAADGGAAPAAEPGGAGASRSWMSGPVPWIALAAVLIACGIVAWVRYQPVGHQDSVIKIRAEDQSELDALRR